MQTRVDNRHDLLNALVWITYLKAKSAINARHYHALTSGAGSPTNAGRGAGRDVNTLLDEPGMILAYADVESARDLSPVPLLGVPGWSADNCNESYYDNTAYFRSGRCG